MTLSTTFAKKSEPPPCYSYLNRNRPLIQDEEERMSDLCMFETNHGKFGNVTSEDEFGSSVFSKRNPPKV